MNNKNTDNNILMKQTIVQTKTNSNNLFIKGK